MYAIQIFYNKHYDPLTLTIVSNLSFWNQLIYYKIGHHCSFQKMVNEKWKKLVPKKLWQQKSTNHNTLNPKSDPIQNQFYQNIPYLDCI